MQINAAASQNKVWVATSIMLFIINAFGAGAREKNTDGLREQMLWNKNEFFFSILKNMGYFPHKNIHGHITTFPRNKTTLQMQKTVKRKSFEGVCSLSVFEIKATGVQRALTGLSFMITRCCILSLDNHNLSAD